MRYKASLNKIPTSKKTADLNPFLILVSINIKKAGPTKKLMNIQKNTPFKMRSIL